MWLSTTSISRYWNMIFEALRKLSKALGSILNESDLRVLSAPGRNGRCFKLRQFEHQQPQTAATSGSPVVRRYASPHAQRVVRTGSYTSLISLREMMRHIDADQTLRRPTIVLVLAANFSGHLPALIQRSTWGCSLVLVAESGKVPLPGKLTLADLAAREAALGWGQIVFERDLEAAFDGALQSLDDDQPLIILSPCWLKDTLPLHVVRQPHCAVTSLSFER